MGYVGWPYINWSQDAVAGGTRRRMNGSRSTYKMQCHFTPKNLVLKPDGLEGHGGQPTSEVDFLVSSLGL